MLCTYIFDSNASEVVPFFATIATDHECFIGCPTDAVKLLLSSWNGLIASCGSCRLTSSLSGSSCIWRWRCSLSLGCLLRYLLFSLILFRSSSICIVRSSSRLIASIICYSLTLACFLLRCRLWGCLSHISLARSSLNRLLGIFGFLGICSGDLASFVVDYACILHLNF